MSYYHTGSDLGKVLLLYTIYSRADNMLKVYTKSIVF